MNIFQKEPARNRGNTSTLIKKLKQLVFDPSVHEKIKSREQPFHLDGQLYTIVSFWIAETFDFVTFYAILAML